MLVDLQIVVSNLDVERILGELKRTVLDGVCLVDFKKLPDRLAVERVKGIGLKVFIGGALPLEKGHVLAFPPTEDFDWDSFAQGVGTYGNPIPKALEAGCALVGCHPYHKDSESSMGDRVLQCHGLDGLIILTSNSSADANDLALEVLDTLAIPGAGGTGAGAPVGRAATLFTTELQSQADLVRELKAGEYWAVAIGPDYRWSSSTEGGLRGRTKGTTQRSIR